VRLGAFLSPQAPPRGASPLLGGLRHGASVVYPPSLDLTRKPGGAQGDLVLGGKRGRRHDGRELGAMRPSPSSRVTRSARLPPLAPPRPAHGLPLRRITHAAANACRHSHARAPSYPLHSLLLSVCPLLSLCPPSSAPPPPPGPCRTPGCSSASCTTSSATWSPLTWPLTCPGSPRPCPWSSTHRLLAEPQCGRPPGAPPTPAWPPSTPSQRASTASSKPRRYAAGAPLGRGGACYAGFVSPGGVSQRPLVRPLASQQGCPPVQDSPSSSKEAVRCPSSCAWLPD